jgi:ABC-2 type transport system permease protein
MQKELYVPGRSRGLIDALRNPFLLKLIVKKEVKVRYRDSFLGLFWTYIKPAISFGVYFFFIGYALGQRHIPAYAVYLFSGMVVVNLFNETFRNCTGSIRGNADLIRKIYLPRELFSLAAWRVALVHFFPQVAILLAGALYSGWFPSIEALFAFALAVVMISIFSVGLGMIFATLNVFFKDAENLVELITNISTWFSPVLYMFYQIRDISGLPHQVFVIYCLNPLTSAVELFHYAFWKPSLHGADFQLERAPGVLIYEAPPHLFEYAFIAFATSVLTLILGQIIFRKFEGRFAEKL